MVLAAALAFAAFALREAASADRPMHTDEAVNAVILGRVLEGATLRYDPQDKHGPTLLFAALPLVRALGVGRLAQLEGWHVRTLPALAGGALVFVVATLFAGGLGRGACFAAMPWLILGAPLVYFGSSFIHETLFVLLGLLLIAALARWWRAPRPGWAAAAGACAGLLVATKETAAIWLFCVGVAAVGCWLTGGGHATARGGIARRWWRDGAIALGAALLVAAIFFTSFGANPGGLVDAVSGWARFVGRAGGEGHEKPWFTYARWLLGPNARTLPWCAWTLLAFGAVGVVAAFRRRCKEPLGWFLALFTVASVVVYSAIPYKTPWLALDFLVPAALVAGLGLRELLARVAPRARLATATLAMLALTGALAAETGQLVFRFPVDPTNPLAYSPSVPDVEGVAALIERRLGSRPPEAPPVIQVVGDDYWPLPWYLRRCERVGYWPELPEGEPGDVVIATGAEVRSLPQRLGARWRGDFVGLRPDAVAIVFTRESPPRTGP